MSWIYLSYPLTLDTFGYGNGERIVYNKVRSICSGDTSNNSSFSMPTHYGTHIDFPYHFDEKGKKSSDYSANDFVFNQVALINLNNPESMPDLLIRNEQLNLAGISKPIELLLIKTGCCFKRFQPEYWEKGFGFHKETALFLKQNLPNLKAIAFDLISLNSYQHRTEGREAHKAFLSEQDILIIEDLDLREVDESTKFKQIVVAPLQLNDTDGAPCTILAQKNE